MRAFYLFLIFFISGCASKFGPVTSNSFRDHITIKRMDRSFALGHTIFNEKECFPVITKPICRLTVGEKAFEATKLLDIESYEISVSSYDDINREYLYMAAAELAMQEGYPMFTPLIEVTSLLCSKEKIYTTNGGISAAGANSAYLNSTTKMNEGSSCLITKRMDIILFRDKTDLSKGVLEKTNSGPAETKHFNPEIDLYRGTTPNLTEYREINNSEYKLFYLYHDNAWKTHYVPADLAEVLRKKLNISHVRPWQVEDMARKNKVEKDADTLSTRKISD